MPPPSRAKDSILSGPVGAVETARQAGFERIIGFDMGGTSTDVSHYNGAFERTYEAQVAGVRMRAPMMQIHTVAAGGGSILHFDGSRFRVGPDSAGAAPGPAAYRRNGPLTVTDCNVMLGRLNPDFFPKVFGPNGDQPIDRAVVLEKFAALAAEISKATGEQRAPEPVAEGFLMIAVANMANAIKEISIQRGYDVPQYTLACFGGAGGQAACRVADALGMTRIFLHPFAGVLSAYGMGLADIRAIRHRTVEAKFEPALMPRLAADIAELESAAKAEIAAQGIAEDAITVIPQLHLKYAGTDAPLIASFGESTDIQSSFETAHRQRYGFVVPEKPIIVDSISVEAVGHSERVDDPLLPVGTTDAAALARVPFYAEGQEYQAPVFNRADLRPGQTVDGPAIILDPTSTTIVEPDWRAVTTIAAI